MDTLNEELKNFWNWSKTNIKELEQFGWINSLEPFEYPNWTRLIEETKLAISNLSNSNSSLVIYKNILTVMALDNEAEEILDYFETYNSVELDKVIDFGIDHPLSDARWQIAELIGRKKEKTYLPYLELLIKDSNTYVERRALFSMNKVNQERAEEIAFNKISSKDDYIRLVSLRILIEQKSVLIQQALDILRTDSFEYIKQEIEQYKRYNCTSPNT